MDKLQQRIDGIQRNAEWLAQNDVRENSFDAAQRIGLIKGDCAAIIEMLDDERPDR